MAEPRELGYDDCERLLRGDVAGRVAVCTPSGPHIVPVNYSVVDDAIYLRTTPYSVLGTYGRNTMTAFEVDHVDHEHQSGWSVVARGRGEVVTDPDEIGRLREQWPPRPWADGNRSLYLRVRWTELTGRRLGATWSSDQDRAVRRTTGGR
jgi:uncharacterized protein